MTSRRSKTTRRSLIRSTTITLVGVTAGCMGRSEDDDDPSEPTETTGIPTEATGQPPLTNATPRRSPPATPSTARTPTASTPSPTPQETTRATPTPTASSTDETTTPPTTQTEHQTTTQPTTTTQTASHSQQHPYLSVGSGTAAFGLDLSRYPVMGSDSAPVDILYWGDYLCDYCSTFATSIHPKLIKNEIKNGRTRFVFLELPNIGQNSQPAAILSKAVWETVAETDPALFWQWHQTVFERQQKAGSGWADFQNLLELTEEVGIDASAVRTAHDAHSDAFASDINAATNAADQASIPGTPAFYIYNRSSEQSKTIIGAQPLSVYRSAIQSVE